jgi:hypothetical protein
MDTQLNYVQPIETHESKVLKTFKKFLKGSTLKYRGSEIVQNLFFSYLLTKYRTSCVIYNEEKRKHGIYIRIDTDNFPNEISDLKRAAEETFKCFKEKRIKDFIIIPISIVLNNNGKLSGHKNLLLYRASNNTIEHFEPHGKYLKLSKSMSEKVRRKIDIFLNHLNEKLKESGFPDVKFIPSNVVCPYERGLQGMEDLASDTLSSEGGGYCAAWTMFFTEMCLKNPELTAKNLLKILLVQIRSMGDDQGSIYLRKVIRGYTNHIYNKLERQYKEIFGEEFTKENIYNFLENYEFEENENDDPYETILYLTENYVNSKYNAEGKRMTRNEFLNTLPPYSDYHNVGQHWIDKSNKMFRTKSGVSSSSSESNQEVLSQKEEDLIFKYRKMIHDYESILINYLDIDEIDDDIDINEDDELFEFINLSHDDKMKVFIDLDYIKDNFRTKKFKKRGIDEFQEFTKKYYDNLYENFSIELTKIRQENLKSVTNKTRRRSRDKSVTKSKSKSKSKSSSSSNSSQQSKRRRKSSSLK